MNRRGIASSVLRKIRKDARLQDEEQHPKPPNLTGLLTFTGTHEPLPSPSTVRGIHCPFVKDKNNKGKLSQK